MSNYISQYDGPQTDEAVALVLNGGTSVADAQAAAADAATSAAGAQAAETGAQAAEAAAQGYAASAAANVAYQNLAALAASITKTAVAVFVYDTSKDSDGGAWRKRCQGTSWYQEALNTATRGATRAFPALALIVADSASVTIYDATDPTLPMWMVFTVETGGWNAVMYGSNTAPTSIFMLNGILGVGTSDGGTAYGNAAFVSFVADKVWKYNAVEQTVEIDIAGRNILQPPMTAGTTSIVNNFVNDIAMTVLPDAPVDQATGLPVPTIAVSTAGGVSVINDNGTVANSSATNIGATVSFDDQNNLVVTRNTQSTNVVEVMSQSDYKTTGFSNSAGYYDPFSKPALMASWGSPSVAYAITKNTDIVTYQTSGGGAVLIAQNLAAPTSSMVHYLTSTWISGWMPGDIKGAFLASTDATSLVTNQLVTNGTFATDVTGWTALGTTTVTWDSSGALQAAETSGGANGGAYQALTTVIGRTYRVSVDITGVVGNTDVAVGASAPGGTENGEVGWAGGSRSVSLTFMATSTTTYLTLYVAPSGTAKFDNVDCYLADADRSVNNNGLIVNGTVTRAPVATGSEMVGYSGFSASNNLQQPYNSALDFGTGDFSVMGWVSGTTGQIIDRSDGSTNTNRLEFDLQAGTLFTNVNGTTLSIGAVPANVQSHICAVRRSGTVYHYVNGALVGSGSLPGSLTGNYPLRVGQSNVVGQNNAFDGSIALLRISATAPSADQIAKIYRDERRLFEAGAQCTLYGTSDAVTALAHDPDTNKLHVGTSAGRSVFDGLVRIANTVSPITTAISAVNDLVMEQ